MKGTSEYRIIEDMGLYYVQRKFITIFKKERWLDSCCNMQNSYMYYGKHGSDIGSNEFDTKEQASLFIGKLLTKDKSNKRGPVVVWESKS